MSTSILPSSNKVNTPSEKNKKTTNRAML